MAEQPAHSVAPEPKKLLTHQLEKVVIRFAGDSGDGMQLTGERFTNEAALIGNDLRTLPDFPAEIRAPAGTLAGVSAFQLQFAHEHVYTPGDAVDVLVAMNPAALRMNLGRVRTGGMVIVNTDQFGKRNVEKAGYVVSPLEDDSLASYTVHSLDISTLTAKAIEALGLPTRQIERCKNFFALGLCFWLYHRDLDHTLAWIERKFKKTPELAEANIRALKAGYFYGETAEVFDARYQVPPAQIAPGTYRNISGNKAMAMGFVAAAHQAKLPLFLGAYPITPASDILHELAQYKSYGVSTFQAEDEIAAISAAIGASFGGALGLTTSSGPGIALKGEALGLAVMVELPLVVVDVQRGGPSTGLPTKTEQADLMQALYGRNSEAPVPVLAAATPGDCFDVAYEAMRIAVTYRTPVIVLSDGYVANGSEPWLVPDSAALPPITPNFRTDPQGFKPYLRDPVTLARPWVRPGTPGLTHRVGGLEKEHITGAVSYDGANHERMVRLRAEKVHRITQQIPPSTVFGPASGDVLLIGWGSTYGALYGAAKRLQAQGKKVSHCHLRYIHPLPPDLKEIMGRFTHVVAPEINMGQLARVLRAETLVDVKSICKVQGQPFLEQEIIGKVSDLLAGKPMDPFLLTTLEDTLAELAAQQLAQAG